MLSDKSTSEYINVVVKLAEPTSVFELHKLAARLAGKPAFISTTDENQDVLLAIKESATFIKQYCHQQWLKELNYQWNGETTHPSESSQAGALEDSIVYDADITNFDFAGYLKSKFDNLTLSSAEVDQLIKGIVDLIKSEGSTVHDSWKGQYKKFDLQDKCCDFYFTDTTIPDKNGTPILLMYWCACFY
ncbi:unnamed protein product [Rhizophagus irregularis]|uniref:Uncharacterized protein n=1 Tax=Rhizophagus irregularis TaxID=588596 RepID=A0A2I1GQC2_9GLOM|nr:hypothetical protein RhiirA4_526149 [Rhizophagus irregularis]CAB4421097.1 unnamed protein product [Rhizophagus irregularis]